MANLNSRFEKAYASMGLTKRIFTWNKLFKQLDTLDLGEASDEIRNELYLTEQSTPKPDRTGLRKARDLILGVNRAVQSDLKRVEKTAEDLLPRLCVLLGSRALLDEMEKSGRKPTKTSGPTAEFEAVLSMFLDNDREWGAHWAEQYPLPGARPEKPVGAGGRLQVMAERGVGPLMMVVKDELRWFLADLTELDDNAEAFIVEVTAQGHGVGHPVIPSLLKKLDTWKDLREGLFELPYAPDDEEVRFGGGLPELVTMPRRWDLTADFIGEFDRWLYKDVVPEWSLLANVFEEWAEEGALDMPREVVHYLGLEAQAAKARMALPEKYRRLFSD